ncbi:MAG TPA: hypothetical protein H9722_03995 [Candidatus Mediterraneibacter pullistercoris]|nr:hypothetical protein [Candidatus Mediterraneibacter pullistercoris]
MTKTREDGPDPAATLLMLAQKQYARCGEIEELTRELSDALDRDDQESVGMLLRMRGQAMSETDKIIKERQKLLDGSKLWQERFEKINNDADMPELTADEKRIRTLLQSSRNILKRTAELDKKMSRRLAGDRSYYCR